MKAKAVITVSSTFITAIKLRRKKLEFSDESSSESSGSDIHWEGDYSCSDHIQELRDASNFSEKEIRSMLKSFFEVISLKQKFAARKLKAYREQQYI